MTQHVGLHVACTLAQVTWRLTLQAAAPCFYNSPTAQTLSSPLPTVAPVTSLYFAIHPQSWPKTKHYLKSIRWRVKNRKSRNFCCAVNHQKAQLLLRGLVPCSSFPDTLKARRDESQTLKGEKGHL